MRSLVLLCGFAALLLPLQADAIAFGSARYCEEGEFLNTFTGQCTECFDCPEGFYARKSCTPITNTICSSCRSSVVIRNADFIYKCETPYFTIFDVIRQRIEQNRLERMKPLPKLFVVREESSESLEETEKKPKVMDGIANVNADDNEEDDETILAKDFEKELLAKYEKGKSVGRLIDLTRAQKDDEEVFDDDGDGKDESEEKDPNLVEEGEELEEEGDSDDDAVGKEKLTKFADGDGDETDSEELVKENDDEEDDDDDNKASDSETSDSDGLQESAEEVPIKLERPWERVAYVPRGLMKEEIDSSDSDSSSSESVEEESRPLLKLPPRFKNFEDSDEDSSSEEFKDLESERQIRATTMAVRVLLFVMALSVVLLLRICLCRRACPRRSRTVHVVPIFTQEQLGYVNRAAENLKAKVNVGEVKYEKLPPAEFV